MILPTKHIRPHRALIGVGADVLGLLGQPMTVSSLWDAIRLRRTAETSSAAVEYRWFVLALDLLYAIQAIEIDRGVIRRAAP